MEDKVIENGGQTVSYKDTLNLPRTDFPIRAQSSVDDPKILARWAQEKLYEKAYKLHQGAQKYVLHDGPPYANGNIHLGTAYNKILKDLVSKSQRMMGKHVPVTPGWDCHGLPIEFKVTSENPGLDPITLKKKCREFARNWVNVQKEQFKQLGVIMDWDNPYLTMNSTYEADTVRAFGKFVEAGYIERKNKTVPWCASCKTVLAIAEIEKYDRKDPSIYVLFTFKPEIIQQVFNKEVNVPAGLLVWTTTPWTLPLNRAVTLKPEAEYELLDAGAQLLIVGKALSDKVCTKLGIEKKVMATCTAENLKGLQVAHPFIENVTVPVITDQFVELSEGTAAVHTAPGCGPEDYEVGLKNKLEIFSPITQDGKYACGIQPEELEGVDVTKAHGWVITQLQEAGTLIHKESVTHAYPHCWRCRNGLIFRATKQWFCDLSHEGLRDQALNFIEQTNFVPERTKNHLKASVGGRLEWCLSRQRVWGTPIIALICNDCDYGWVPVERFDAITKNIETNGMEYWDTATVEDIVGKNSTCPQCSSAQLIKEQAILDVWFDSGVSHFAVLKQNSALSYPADMYIEGIDQHRGWFQSSLLTSVVLEGKPFTKNIATHGYTVDEKGRKMSKSLGNVVLPEDMIKKMGSDGLRLWCSSIDIESDVVVSETLLLNIQEVFRKIRNTCRFLVSNLYDFDLKKDALKLNELRALDQYAIMVLNKFNAEVQQAYNRYDFTAVYHLFTDYCTVELSAFYLDIVKDRLYTDQADGYARRSAQTACWLILDTLTKLMAPILSFTAEQLSDCYQTDKTESIHLQTFPLVNSLIMKTIKEEQWQALRKFRSIVLKAIEKLRKEGTIKHSLEAKVTIKMNTAHESAQSIMQLFTEVEKYGQTKEQFLKEYFIVSQCLVDEVEDTQDYEDEDVLDEEGYSEFSDCFTVDSGLLVKAGHADGIKCPRCWQWEVTDHQHGLCTRCQSVVSQK